ncbi:MAG: MATE family efflux transporter [Dehalococcoidia bacterium]|nr:MAG: MATE family efflux transporter [Dehalococcoidia bacterium]
MQEYTERLGYAPLGRLLLRLSLPSIAATVTLSLYNIVDTFWVSKLGHEAIAALTIVFPYQILVIALGVGTGIGIAALVSRRFGENNPEATNHVAGQTFFLSVFWGLIFMMFAVFFSEGILTTFGATPDIMEYGTQYLVITAYGAPQVIFALVASNLIRGSGDAIKPMIIMITASAINIILDPFMILGLGPFPEMGVRGAALATVIAQSFGAILALYYLLAHRTAFRIRVGHLRPNMPILGDIYRVGAPSSILEITESLCFILFNIAVSSFGSIAIAAVGIVLRIADLAFMPIIGLSHGLLPIIGFNFGAGYLKRLWKAVKLASVGIMLALGVITLFIEIFAPQIVGIFSDNPELLTITVPAMRIMLSAMLLIGPSVMFITTFQGLSKGTMALILSLVRQFIFFLPLLYLLRYLLGLHGVWLSLPASDVLGFIVTFSILYREYRRQRKSAKWSGGPLAAS